MQPADPSEHSAEAPMATETGHVGFVALIGEPNVGKSTLLNTILGEKVAIATPRPQTTRSRILGIHNQDNDQLIFIDTPGLVFRQTPLASALRQLAGSAVDDADLCIVVVDASNAHKGLTSTASLMERFALTSSNTIVALNKVDQLDSKGQVLPLIAAMNAELGVEDIVPISALKDENLGRLLQVVKARLPVGPRLFDADTHTDQVERQLCSELVREQLLFQLQQEVPHAAAVVIDEFDESQRHPESTAKDSDAQGLVKIYGRIIVERESQKGIIVGRGGKRIREVSTKARKAMEAMLDAKVFLRLEARVDPDWTRKQDRLAQYGIGTAINSDR